MKQTNTSSANYNSTPSTSISPERRETIMNRVEAILNRGNNVEIKRRSNGIIAVLEIKAIKYEV